MPHAVFDWDRSVQELASTFLPIVEENNDWRIMIRDWYSEIQGNKAIVAATVVEEGHVQNFYIFVIKNSDQQTVTIRLDPATDPVKTRGVKRSIALLTEKVHEWNRDIRLKKHNLKGYFQVFE